MKQKAGSLKKKSNGVEKPLARLTKIKRVKTPSTNIRNKIEDIATDRSTSNLRMDKRRRAQGSLVTWTCGVSTLLLQESDRSAGNLGSCCLGPTLGRNPAPSAAGERVGRRLQDWTSDPRVFADLGHPFVGP